MSSGSVNLTPVSLWTKVVVLILDIIFHWAWKYLVFESPLCIYEALAFCLITCSSTLLHFFIYANASFSCSQNWALQGLTAIPSCTTSSVFLKFSKCCWYAARYLFKSLIVIFTTFSLFQIICIGSPVILLAQASYTFFLNSGWFITVEYSLKGFGYNALGVVCSNWS